MTKLATLSQNLCCKWIVLLMLVSDFMVNSMLKNTHKGTSVKCMKCLNKDARKKKYGQILYIVSRNDQITTSAYFHLALHMSLMDSLLM